MRPFKHCRNPRSANPIGSLKDDIAKDGYARGKHEVILLDAANGAKGARKGKGDR
jgi:hypothetical protein